MVDAAYSESITPSIYGIVLFLVKYVMEELLAKHEGMHARRVFYSACVESAIIGAMLRRGPLHKVIFPSLSHKSGKLCTFVRPSTVSELFFDIVAAFSVVF